MFEPFMGLACLLAISLVYGLKLAYMPTEKVKVTYRDGTKQWE